MTPVGFLFCNYRFDYYVATNTLDNRRDGFRSPASRRLKRFFLTGRRTLLIGTGTRWRERDPSVLEGQEGKETMGKKERKKGENAVQQSGCERVSGEGSCALIGRVFFLFFF